LNGIICTGQVSYFDCKTRRPHGTYRTRFPSSFVVGSVEMIAFILF
jgi:hypothetical protein